MCGACVLHVCCMCVNQAVGLAESIRALSALLGMLPGAGDAGVQLTDKGVLAQVHHAAALSALCSERVRRSAEECARRELERLEWKQAAGEALDAAASAAADRATEREVRATEREVRAGATVCHLHTNSLSAHLYLSVSVCLQSALSSVEYERASLRLRVSHWSRVGWSGRYHSLLILRCVRCTHSTQTRLLTLQHTAGHGGVAAAASRNGSACVSSRVSSI